MSGSISADGEPRFFRRQALVSLFLISLFSISFETFLTRYFAVALFSQYSYWIISIAMLGYSVSGVVISLFEGFFRRRRAEISFLIPLALIVFTTAAFAMLRLNPFNPLEFQNEALWKGQLVFVLLYYLGLFPVFFFSGIFVGLCFLLFHAEMGRVYAVDLFGAAAGALGILGMMFLLHPYHLPAAMLAVLFLVFLLNAGGSPGGLRSVRSIVTMVVVLAGTGSAILWVARVSPMSIPDFKPLHAILNIAGRTVERSVLSPSGYYLVMDDYTERDDLPMTNDYSRLGIGAPPRSYGIYIDGGRVAPLLKDRLKNPGYFRGSLSYFPYSIRKGPRVLLVGTNGGFQVLESVHAGARQVLAVEQQRVLYNLVSAALKKAAPGLLATGAVELRHGSVFSALRRARGSFDIIEIASDYLAQGGEGGYAFTREALDLSLRSLAPGGVLSIPVDISALNVFALRVLNAARAALIQRGVADPRAYVMAYRTAWTCQILVSNEPFGARDVQALKHYCARRSFDTPYYPGIDPAAVTVWNDLPPIPFDNAPASVVTEQSTSNAPSAQAVPVAQDSLMQEMTSMMKHPSFPVSDSRYFTVAPASLDRPDFYSVSRLSRLSTLLSHISLLPEQEVGYILNVFVLGQAAVLGGIVLVIPLLILRRRNTVRAAGRGIFTRTLLYFGFLGLGFLFIELALIQKLSIFLGGATTSFAVTLSSMLVFSALGSWSSHGLRQNPRRGLLQSVPIIAAGALLIAFALDPLLLAAIGLPEALKLPLAVAFIAPIAFAMGRPFPLGTTATADTAAHLVPWAWAVNGAFSVISTPLASLISTTFGWRMVMAAALVLYAAAIPAFPGRRHAAPEG
jgi:hypothetical protein